MRIEELRQPTRKGGRITLVFEDDSTMKLLPVVALDMGLYPGLDLDDKALQELKKAAGEASAKDRAVRIISASGVTKKDLEQRLVQKGESQEDARRAVEWLSELELLNDREIACQIAAKGASRGYGAARIKQMLYEKRVPKEYWEDALAQLPEMDGEIDRFLQQRFGGEAPDRQQVKKAVDALMRRGHSWNDISAGLRRYSSSLEDLEE